MKRHGSWIVLFLLLQGAIPLEYYSHRADPRDERFAWRMFSPERAVRCAVGMRVGERTIPLRRTFHEAWLQLAARGRVGVVERMADHACADVPGEPLRVRLVCLEAGEGEPRTILDTTETCPVEPGR